MVLTNHEGIYKQLTMIITSSKSIKAGDQLSFDYGKTYWQAEGNDAIYDSSQIDEEDFYGPDQSRMQLSLSLPSQQINVPKQLSHHSQKNYQHLGEKQQIISSLLSKDNIYPQKGFVSPWINIHDFAGSYPNEKISDGLFILSRQSSKYVKFFRISGHMFNCAYRGIYFGCLCLDTTLIASIISILQYQNKQALQALFNTIQQPRSLEQKFIFIADTINQNKIDLDAYICQKLRKLVIQYILKNKQQVSKFSEIPITQLINNIKSSQKESIYLQLIVLSKILNISIIIEAIDEKGQHWTNSIGAENHQITIFLLHRPGHYDFLKSIRQIQM